MQNRRVGAKASECTIPGTSLSELVVHVGLDSVSLQVLGVIAKAVLLYAIPTSGMLAWDVENFYYYKGST